MNSVTMSKHSGWISIARDEKTKRTRAECEKAGEPYEPLEDIEVEVSGNVYFGTNDSDDPTEVEDIVAVMPATMFVPDEQGMDTDKVFFAKGEKIVLTEEEEQRAQDDILSRISAAAYDY